ncbi:MAG: 4-hydroxythreonine-4-phosphate dehydrogenase PdxA [Planctomycetes bacterium]|nr:4-hydroxythreonine-4-phosphate dehydrogenase PdxA [Planctomycetota bacterium]
MSRLRIALTMGDPAGIGPEVILKTLQEEGVRALADYVVLGHREFLEQAAREQGGAEVPQAVGSADDLAGGAAVLEVGDRPRGGVPQGQVSAEAGRLSVGYVLRAIELAQSGAVDAIVTAPIHKEAILRAGYHFPGHTEILAQQTNTRRYVMMLVGGPLRVALVTIHVPLKRVFSLLTEEAILQTVRITDESLRRYFSCPSPRIGVCGLNPHASDGGRFGDEEERVVRPAIEMARKKGTDCQGPLPPDTAFYQAAKGRFDAVVALYHDQGLIPLKLLAFETGVNVTLGLPIIRTSVDHGTAFDIVGKNQASHASMVEAIRLAVQMAMASAEPPGGPKA